MGVRGGGRIEDESGDGDDVSGIGEWGVTAVLGCGFDVGR